jgi:meso-butanediol dehydrogenase / (S,S)-butanediol dehydrogenase / diacetyl reductase
MNGKVAVVTGAGSGIGAAIAAELASRGAAVLVTDVDGAQAEAVARRINAVSQPFDVTDRETADRIAAFAGEELGALDVWVSNAGISSMAPFVDVSEADLEATLAVNVKGPFLCGQAAARAMVAQGRGGAIVNVASMAGKRGAVPYLAHYVASKFAVVGLTQAMAYELAEHGIRVNAVCPGYVATAMQDRELEWEAKLRGSSRAAVRELWVADTPLGRLEQPEDVARCVAFLAGDDAGFVTGEALAVNGGAYMD